MKRADFNFNLPAELIAQHPADRRDESRLLILDRGTDRLRHLRFRDIMDVLAPGDVLVVNDTRVMPWKVTGRRVTGGRIEGLLIEELADGIWRAMFKSHGKLQPGERLLLLERNLTAKLIEKDDQGVWTVRFSEEDPRTVLERFGFAPLPPYIRRGFHWDEIAEEDRRRYQTTFAERPGAIAAPTAGLHFTAELIESLCQRNVTTERITLHVGIGTFQPVKADEIEAHRMHAERYELSEVAAERINARRQAGGRIVAVGTTSVRVVETCADESGALRPGAGETNLFIYPGYRFRAVDALLTNFHLPESTLLMLVCAFAGRERILAAYDEAVREGYRFFSYGDAMLIL